MASNDIVVYGVGGLGRDVMWQLAEVNRVTNEFNILGFVDDSPEKQGAVINGFPVLGDAQWLLERNEKINVAVAVGNPATRKKIVEKLSVNKSICYPNIIADHVIMSEFAELGKGCIICCSSIITVNIKIGDFFVSNLDCTVEHDSVIGNFVTLAPSVNISGNVTIGDLTDVGTGANIIQGKNIGSSTIIGAGSVVIRDIPDNCTAVGVPAKPIKFH